MLRRCHLHYCHRCLFTVIAPCHATCLESGSCVLEEHNSSQSHTTGKLDIAHCYYYKRFALLLLGTVFSVLYYCLVQWDSAYSNGRVESAQDALGSKKKYCDF